MFYIIHGNDNYRCHQALSEIKTGLGSEEVVSVNTTTLDGRKLTLRELSDVCNAVPFMSPHRLIVVEGLLKRFQPGEKQRANGNHDNGEQTIKEWQGIAGLIKAMPSTTVLILFETGLDSRGSNALLKTLSPVADKVFHLTELKGKDIASWIREYAFGNNNKISAAAVTLLADYVGGDLWLLTGELNKLMTYCGGREITDKDVRELTSFAREDNIFVLVDSILEGKIKDAQVMLHRMLKYGTAPQQILAMVERQLSIVLRVKELSNDVPQTEIKERLGLHPKYPLEKTLKQARTYTIPRLRKAFHCLLDTDIAIKTGKYDDDLALDIMVIELCKH